MQQPAFARIEVQLQRVALVAVAETPHVDVARGGHLVLDRLVTGAVGRHAGLALDQFGVALEVHFAVGTAGDFLGADGDRRVRVVHLDPLGRRLRMQRPRGGGDDRTQGVDPGLRRGGG
jgi:hypothetical protein